MRPNEVAQRLDGGVLVGGPSRCLTRQDITCRAHRLCLHVPLCVCQPGLAASERHALLLAQMRALELADRAAETPAAIGRAAASDAVGRERNPRRQRELLHRVAGTARLERRLRRALEKADATLLGFGETTNPDGTSAGIVVEWSDSGGRHRYRSVLAPDLDVVSSGICLSGRDGDFDLTSLVSVMAAAPK